MKAKVKATGKIVDGIPIYYGSEGKGYLDVPVDHDIFDRYDIEEVELLEQPPLPEGLEEAAKEYTDWKSWAKENYLTPYIREAFIAGAEWQKAKMLKEAVEGRVYRINGNNVVENLIVSQKFQDGDKVCVIVIKEDTK